MKGRILAYGMRIATLAAVAWSLGGLELSFDRLARGVPKFVAIVRQMFGPPDWTYLPQVGAGLVESIQIAALGTAIAAVLALPFGVLAARNLARNPAPSAVGKVLLDGIRTFPEILLAIAFIKGLGLGPFPGVMAVAVHSIGMLGKLYAERIEGADRGAIEALTASGASPSAIFRHAVLPEVFPDLLSFALYRFDLNVRSASVLGLVGAGGIGALLSTQYQAANYPRIGVIVVGIVATVGLVDLVSGSLRRRLA
ncbi:MAG: phosphonate ABC transporter, permease protein PhnE [Armatimonadota bacterium]